MTHFREAMHLPCSHKHSHTVVWATPLSWNPAPCLPYYLFFQASSLGSFSYPCSCQCSPFPWAPVVLPVLSLALESIPTHSQSVCSSSGQRWTNSPVYSYRLKVREESPVQDAAGSTAELGTEPGVLTAYHELRP